MMIHLPPLTAEERLGGVVERVRRERNRTQAGLAQALGVTVTTVSRWENGHSPISLDRLRAICEYLDVKPSELLAAAEEHSGL